MSRKLGIEPYFHETAAVSNSTFGRYTEVSERCRISEAEFGDYSYIMQDGSIWCATIGKFVNIAAAVRINATNHPTWRATLHHFTYRAVDYWPDADMESEFFEWRRSNRVVIGNDVCFPREIGERMDRLAWWDWEHDRLRGALADFRALGAEDFLSRYGG